MLHQLVFLFFFFFEKNHQRASSFFRYKLLIFFLLFLAKKKLVAFFLKNLAKKVIADNFSFSGALIFLVLLLFFLQLNFSGSIFFEEKNHGGRKIQPKINQNLAKSYNQKKGNKISCSAQPFFEEKSKAEPAAFIIGNLA